MDSKFNQAVYTTGSTLQILYPNACFKKRAYIIIFSSLFFWSFTVGFSFTLSYSSCSRGTAAAKSQRV